MKRETLDPSWHKARIAARIWLKAQQGKLLSPRDRRLARRFAADAGISNRLMEHAVTFWQAPYTLDENLNRQLRVCHVVVP